MERFQCGVHCLSCDKIMYSKHRHDFVECDCGTFVDGGRDYLRYGGEYGKLVTIDLLLNEVIDEEGNT